jgi:hypothetical protein
MNIQEVLDYVMHTPANTNPNVLKSMLQALSEQEKIKLGTLMVSTNGTYESPDGAYRKVIVNVNTSSSNNLNLVDVTITSNGMNFNKIYLPNYDSSGNLNGTVILAGPGTQNVQVPIDSEKGLTGVMSDFDLATPVTVTGDITYTAGEFGITGAGTITV